MSYASTTALGTWTSRIMAERGSTSRYATPQAETEGYVQNGIRQFEQMLARETQWGQSTSSPDPNSTNAQSYRPSTYWRDKVTAGQNNGTEVGITRELNPSNGNNDANKKSFVEQEATRRGEDLERMRTTQEPKEIGTYLAAYLAGQSQKQVALARSR